MIPKGKSVKEFVHLLWENQDLEMLIYQHTEMLIYQHTDGNPWALLSLVHKSQTWAIESMMPPHKPRPLPARLQRLVR